MTHTNREIVQWWCALAADISEWMKRETLNFVQHQNVFKLMYHSKYFAFQWYDADGHFNSY